MEHDIEATNPTCNRTFDDVLRAYVSRRSVLAGGLGALSTLVASGGALAAARGSSQQANSLKPLINFTPVPNASATGPEPSISEDYAMDTLIPWGDPLQPGGPAFSYPPNSADQAVQIGIGHDGMSYFPLPSRRDPLGNGHGLLVVNNEFGDNSHVLGKETVESLEDVRVSQHAHGVTLVEIAKDRDGIWKTVLSQYARRIHVNTPVDFSGPVAGHPLLATPNGNVPLGTVNNCANGRTPWGTYLTCEENFNGYFGSSDPSWTPSESQARYGFSVDGFGYGWHLYDKRFDLADRNYQNEENRFGWIVEIDPFNIDKPPVKRTALGRVKHENAEVVVGGNDRAVVYMGDDQRFDYIYKFVSADAWPRMIANGESPLDRGVLYVARFNEDGTGDWLELSLNVPALADRFADMGELLVNTRLAADIVGATQMDRPEWITTDNRGRQYCALTNNSKRTEPNPANPLAPNPDGHIIRWHDGGRNLGLSFIWEIFLIAQDTHGTEDSFSDPDGLWADPDGRLFIETDGGQQEGMNNQMLVANTQTGELRRLFSGVAGCEITGITYTPDRRTMFVNVQHPGNGDPALTSFPLLFDGTSIPRDATVVIRRRDGGIIGS